MLRKTSRVTQNQEATLPQHLEEWPVFRSTDQERRPRDELADGSGIEMRWVAWAYGKTEDLPTVRPQETVRSRQPLGPLLRQPKRNRNDRPHRR